MRYCEKCGLVIDEFNCCRDEQNCPICSGAWSEDDMTALKYAKLSEQEKDNYDENLLNLIKSSPLFDEHIFCLNGNSPKDGGFWAGFRVDKWRELDSSLPIEEIDASIESRKKREPFKPFPPIDIVKAREVALVAEIAHKAMDEINVPRCPICQSTRLGKISTGRKLLQAGFGGIWGMDVLGKTYECLNCGSKF